MDKKKTQDYRPIIGISHGDFNSINYEIMLKALSDMRMNELFSCVIYGSVKACVYYQNLLDMPKVPIYSTNRSNRTHNKKINVLNLTEEDLPFQPGESTKDAGLWAFKSLEKAVDDLSAGYIHALVTAPIDKHNIQSEQFKYAGHTDYLADKFESTNQLMFLVAGNLRIGVVTGHIPIKEVAQHITTTTVLTKINAMHRSLVYDFGIAQPRIAVLGLNPHASDMGLIGDEEQKEILPAIERARAQKMLVYGPYPADGFFASASYKEFDAILAMYHDQGLIAFKTLAFENGVNFTAGLPVVRTSPAHGTAFDIAGKNIASEASLRAAIYLAADILQNRKAYEINNRNPLMPSRFNKNQQDEDISALPDVDDNNDGLRSI